MLSLDQLPLQTEGCRHLVSLVTNYGMRNIRPTIGSGVMTDIAIALSQSCVSLHAWYFTTYDDDGRVENEYNKLALYVKELEVVKKGVKLSDAASDRSDSDDEFGTEGDTYSITPQQISCAKRKSAVAGLSPYDAVRHAAMRDLAGERGVALPRTMRTTRSLSPPRQRWWSAARRQSFGA